MRLKSQLVSGVTVLLTAGSLGAPLAQAAATDARVPPGFVASSTSWTSTRDGWVLGYSPCSNDPQRRCGALVHTTDGGASWQHATVPGVRVSPRFIQVRIEFAARTKAGEPVMGLAATGSGCS